MERGQLDDSLAPRQCMARPAQTYYVAAPTISDNAAYLLVKRIFDLTASFTLGVVLSLPMAIIAVMIRLDSPGPAVFRQERLGKDGEPFILYKFRSMGLDAEADGPQWAVREDIRCTRAGRILRRSRLDELPQLWNIFLGDMSFVGPRPERAYFYAEFERYIHGFQYRLAVKPGLTGLAQINGGYELKPEEKIVYDMEYIRTRTVWGDMKLVLQTLRLIFTHEGAR